MDGEKIFLKKNHTQRPTISSVSTFSRLPLVSILIFSLVYSTRKMEETSRLVVVLDAHRLSHNDDSVMLFGRRMDGDCSRWQLDRVRNDDPLAADAKWFSALPHRLPSWLRLPCIFDEHTRAFSSLDIGHLLCEVAVALPLGQYALYPFLYGDARTPEPNSVRVLSNVDALLNAVVSGVLFTDSCEVLERVRQLRRTMNGDVMRHRLPCVCDPDTFILHANLNVAPSGAPIVYHPPFEWLPDQLAACYTPTVLMEKALILARHRVEWIRGMQIVEFAQTLCSVTGMSFAAALAPTSSEISDSMIEHTYVEAGGSLPLPARDDTPVEFQGGLVLDLPRGAFHGNIVVFDATSMYPSMVVEYQLDPLLERLFRQLIAMRREHEKQSVHGRALKLVANKLFGTRAHGRYANVRLAAEITRRGREVLQTAVDRAAATPGFRVLAGDTDSLIVLCERDPQALLDELNRGWRFVEFKVDATFMSLYMVTRKSYFAVQPDGGYYVRGLESIQSGVLPVIKRIHCEWQRRLAGNQFQCKELADEWVRAEAERLRANPPESLLDQCSWPKPTRQHPERDRARFCCEDKSFVSRAVAMQCGAVTPRISIDHWIQLQLVDPLLRYNEVLF